MRKEVRVSRIQQRYIASTRKGATDRLVVAAATTGMLLEGIDNAQKTGVRSLTHYANGPNDNQQNHYEHHRVFCKSLALLT